MHFILWFTLLGETTCLNLFLRHRLEAPHFREYFSEYLVDGNRYNLAARIIERCPDGYVWYLFDGFFYVHAVVLYDRLRSGCSFSVSFFKNDSEVFCGSYLMKKNVAFMGMRVNCETITVLVNKMRLDLVMLPVYLQELEILTLASGQPGEIAMIYRGCFDSFRSTEEKFITNFKMCGEICLTTSNTYAVLQGETCYCGNEFDMTDMQPESRCNTSCSTSDKKCGGNETYSVYLVQVQLPYYKGCVNSSHASDLQSRDMTVVKCLQRCDDSYFAMLKNGNSCTCINDNSKFSFVSFELCNVSCSGDKDSFCGGTDHWAVYRTCFKTNPPTLPCSKLFHCARSWDEYGVCEGGCESGYVGEHCIEREIEGVEKDSCFSPDACKDLDHVFCLYNSKFHSYDCHCINGYWQFQSHLCEDYDECKYGDACDEVSSTCENSIGSYKCKCKANFQSYGANSICEEIPGMENITKSGHLCSSHDPCKGITGSFCYYNIKNKSYQCLCHEGYWKYQEFCEDIDECMFEACDNKTSTCLNTNGSFACICRQELQQLAADVCTQNVTTVYNMQPQNLVYNILIVLLGMILFGFLMSFGRKIDKTDLSSVTGKEIVNDKPIDS